MFRKNLQIGQGKAFCRERKPECSCARKETGDMISLQHLGVVRE